MNNELICAGIVTYNPDIDRLKENIMAILKQVKKLYICDNGSNNIILIEGICDKISEDIELIKNKKNMGIAYALNVLIDSSKDKYEWLLTLDQDSVVMDGLINEYSKYTNISNIGMIACEIKDRNYNLKKKKITKKYVVVKKCITSGTLTNIKACIGSGGFDNKLFIDSVDYDMCYSMSEHGYKTIKVNFVGLLHEVGKSKAYSIGNVGFAVNNHSAQRKYYISRNSVYMIKKHKLNAVVEYFYVYRRIFTVLFFENDKRNKIKSILKGIRDGKKMA